MIDKKETKVWDRGQMQETHVPQGVKEGLSKETIYAETWGRQRSWPGKEQKEKIPGRSMGPEMGTELAYSTGREAVSRAWWSPWGDQV